MVKFMISSFGCRVNQAEKAELSLKLTSLGFLQDEVCPKVIIIYTCAVTNKAEREARQKIYHLRRKYPEAKIIITGCAATYWLKLNPSNSALVDLVVPNQDKEKLPKLITNILPHQPTRNLTGCGRPGKIGRIRTESLLIDKFNFSGRYLIKIQDGCHRFCSYCIVPYLRSLPKSRTIKSVIDQINVLPGNIREAVLTAINTEDYGYDTGEKLTDLIADIFNQTTIKRLSFGSINPWSINKILFPFIER